MPKKNKDNKKHDSKLIDVLLRPAFKNTVMAVLTTAIAAAAAIFPGLRLRIILLSILAVIYILATIFYSSFENKYYSECRQLENSIEAYEDALRRINSICRISAKTINQQIHEIQDTGKYNPNAWNFVMACDLTCEQCFETLSILLSKKRGRYPDIGVGYVRLIESEPDQKIISLCSYHQYRNSDNRPSILKKERIVKEHDDYSYHDAELFLAEKDQPDILLTMEAVQEKFQYSKNNKKKYKQYVAVPVFCDKESKPKMVGLLEICCFENNCFPDDPTLVNGYIDDIIRPYAYVILLLHKMEKALLAVPNTEH